MGGEIGICDNTGRSNAPHLGICLEKGSDDDTGRSNSPHLGIYLEKVEVIIPGEAILLI